MKDGATAHSNRVTWLGWRIDMLELVLAVIAVVAIVFAIDHLVGRDG